VPGKFSDLSRCPQGLKHFRPNAHLAAAEPLRRPATWIAGSDVEVVKSDFVR
jgi:hypothetical protein